MSLIQRLLAITLLAITPLGLMTACGDKEAGTAAPAASNAPGSNIRSDGPAPWANLSELEQGVLSVLQGQWDSIPANEQAVLRKGASRWTLMSPEEQAEFKESWKKYL